MLAIEFLRKPGHAGRRPIYALHGEDAYLRRESIAAIVRETLGNGADEFSVTRFAGETALLSAVLDELRTLPFLAKARVAIVENADPFVTAHRKELEAYAEKPSSSGVLVVSAKSWPSNTKLAKIVEKVGLSIDCAPPKEKELAGWLRGLAKAKGQATLDDDAASLLVELVGPEIGLLAAELEKLATYAGDSKRIRREDVAVLVDAGRTQKVWAALDFATTGKGSEALQALDSLLAAGEPPIKLLAAMNASLQKVYHAGQLRRARIGGREACQTAGIPPFAIEKTLQQHTHLGPRRVDRLPETLLRADLDLKGMSQLSPRVIMERLLAAWAEPRED